MIYGNEVQWWNDFLWADWHRPVGMGYRLTMIGYQYNDLTMSTGYDWLAMTTRQ